MKPAYLASCFLFLGISTAGQNYRIATYAGGAPPPSPVRASDATIAVVLGLASDSSGAVYFPNIDSNCIFKLTPDGTVTRFAGNGRPGYTGDGGPAASASLHLDYRQGFAAPIGIAVDKNDNVFVADIVNARIRRISPDGIITTVAGNGAGGNLGDGGPAIQAQLIVPTAVAIDGEGGVYISDRADYRVRKISSSGIISTVAGNGRPLGPSGDGGPATSAVVVPDALAVDGQGNLFIAEYGGRIRRVSAEGAISTIASSRTTDVGLGGVVKIQPSSALGIAVDRIGNLLISDGPRLLKLFANGRLGVVAGKETPGYSGDGGSAADAELGSISAVAVDGQDNIFIAENARIRKITSENSILTVAGNGRYGPESFSGDGGPATGAQLRWPWGVATDEHGSVFIADAGNNRVRRVAPDGTIETVAGNGSAGFSGDYGPAREAQLNVPTTVTVDRKGNLFIIDAGNQRIRKISDGIITTVAGNGAYGFSGDGGPATSATLGFFATCNVWCSGLAVDGDGNLYLADVMNGRVRKIATDGVITTVAGNGSNDVRLARDGVPAKDAELAYPSGVAIDQQGNLFIAQPGRIRKVSPDGRITTIAGDGSAVGGAADGGPALAARLSYPIAVSVDRTGNVFFADPGWKFIGDELALDPADHRVRKISADGVITTLAGDGAPGFTGDQGPAAAARLAGPVALAVGAGGEIYVAEAKNHVIRVLRPEPDGLHRSRPPFK